MEGQTGGERQMEGQTDRFRNRPSDLKTDSQVDKETDRWRSRQTGGEGDKQRNRQLVIHSFFH